MYAIRSYYAESVPEGTGSDEWCLLRVYMQVQPSPQKLWWSAVRDVLLFLSPDTYIWYTKHSSADACIHAAAWSGCHRSTDHSVQFPVLYIDNLVITSYSIHYTKLYEKRFSGSTLKNSTTRPMELRSEDGCFPAMSHWQNSLMVRLGISIWKMHLSSKTCWT